VPGAYKDEGAYDGKKMIEKGSTTKNMRKNIKKVPRAYESLNPALPSYIVLLFCIPNATSQRGERGGL
jgi:hypothetical protein